MSIFLTLIPRSNQDQDTTPLLETIHKRYEHVVGNAYGTVPVISKPGSGNPARLLCWKRDNDQASMEANGDAWAVAAGSPVAREILSKVRIRADKPVYDAPAWGAYAVVLGQRHADRLVAWNTTPALEAIHYAADDACIAISNRPLLVAMAMARGNTGRLLLSEDYLDEYLLYGFNITSQSPFVGVHVLDPTKALAVSHGSCRLVPLPPGLEADLPCRHRFEDGVEALAAALQRSSARAVRSVSTGQIQLRMSGGKDSRLLLGLLKDEPVSSYAVLYGKPSDSETKVGYYLCSRAGIDFRYTAPRPVAEETLSEKVARTIALSDGIPASEPHTAIYQGSTPAVNGEGIMLGQWPLFKGGMAKKLRYAPGAIDRILIDQGSWIVAQHVRAPYDQFIRDWKASRMVHNDLEYLYLFAREFRSGRWLQGHINLYERDATIAYPIADAEVAAVSDSLTMFEKTSERTLFGALEKIWPVAAATPLSNSEVWRFEAGGPDEQLGRDTYQMRQRELDVVVPRAEGPAEFPAAYEYTIRAAEDLAAGLLASPRLEVLERKLDPAFVPYIQQTAAGNFRFPEHASRRAVIKLLWRLFVADTWLSRSWLRR